MSLGGKEVVDPYHKMGTTGVRLFGQPAERVAFDVDCQDFCDNPNRAFRTDFFTFTVAPMFQTWMAYRSGDIGRAMGLTDAIRSLDWGHACYEWLQRRFKTRLSV
jgi:hypothetical protein